MDATARDAAVIDGLQRVVAANPRWGFWKCYDRLRLDGHTWNHKRVYRVYCGLGLHLPRRTRRRVPPRMRRALVGPDQLNAIWPLDFMHDTLYGGRLFRTLNVLDAGNREGLASEVGTSIPAPRVVRVLDQLVALYGCPQALRLDNGPELTARASQRAQSPAMRGPLDGESLPLRCQFAGAACSRGGTSLRTPPYVRNSVWDAVQYDTRNPLAVTPPCQNSRAHRRWSPSSFW